MIEHWDEALPAIASAWGCPVSRIRKLDASLAKHGQRTASQRGPNRLKYTRRDALALALAHAFSAKLEAGKLVNEIMESANTAEGHFDRSTLYHIEAGNLIELRFYEMQRYVERTVCDDAPGHEPLNHRFTLPGHDPEEPTPPAETIRFLGPDWLAWIKEEIAA